MNTKLSDSFLLGIDLMTDYKGPLIRKVEACLLLLALRSVDFSADEIPAELLGGNNQVSGCAAGHLVRIGLIEYAGRVKSNRSGSNGRKVNLFRLCANKRETARTWLERQGFSVPELQQEMRLTA